MFSCAQRPKLATAIRGLEKAAQEDKSPLTLDLKSVESDALTYTWGMVKAKAHAPADISLRRLAVWGDSKDKVTDATKEKISQLCSQMALFDEKKEANESPGKAEAFYFGWRSHASVHSKEALAEAMDQEGIQGLSCVAELTLEMGAKSIPYYIVVDPFPSGDDLAGAEDIEAATALGVHLIAMERSGTTLEFDKGNALDLTEEFKSSDLVLEVKALTPQAVNVVPEQKQADVACYHDLTNSQMVVNPKRMIEMNYQVSVNEGHILGDIVMGLGDPLACGDMKPELSEGSLQTRISCGMSSENLINGDSCNIGVLVENKDDSQNVIKNPIVLKQPKFDKIDVSTKAGALQGISKFSDNPVVSAQTKLVNFSAAQARAVESSFNLWLYVSPESYNTYFRNHIVQITYQGNATQPCQQMAGAYVDSFNTNQFNWCISGAMDPNAVSDQVYLEAQMYVALTAFHETLHTKMHYHDATDPRGAAHAPCDGTSKSAMLARDMYVCKDPVCLPFRDRALEAFRSELEYSLPNDPRANMGRCAEWKKDMGIQ